MNVREYYELAVLQPGFKIADDIVLGGILNRGYGEIVERRNPQTDHRPLGHPDILVVSLGNLLDSDPSADQAHRDFRYGVNRRQTPCHPSAGGELGAVEPVRIVP